MVAFEAASPTKSMRAPALFAAISIEILCATACHLNESRFIVVRADREVSAGSAYPVAVDPSRVGSYPSEAKSGAGYFYDDVLEYRVWLHPEKGAAPRNRGNDYFVAFAQYERAEAFYQNARGAEPPLALVRQIEWIDEPDPKRYVPMKGMRLTEWRVSWLADSKRASNSISEFLKDPRRGTAE